MGPAGKCRTLQPAGQGGERQGSSWGWLLCGMALLGLSLCCLLLFRYVTSTCVSLRSAECTPVQACGQQGFGGSGQERGTSASSKSGAFARNPYFHWVEPGAKSEDTFG